MSALSVFAPAKLNLFLAITGRRPDGFHNLVSLVAPLAHGDTLQVEPRTDESYSLACDAPGVPTDESNLVLKAARLFREATGARAGAAFTLRKEVPAGAGLGGGSSDGTAALLALNQLAGSPLATGELARLAAQLGSDCPLFLKPGPSIMRGRGEQLSPVPSGVAGRLSGRRVLLCKPEFGISTVWAYRQLAAGAPQSYVPADEAEARLAAWCSSPSAPAEDVMFNSMEGVAFEKYPALPALRRRLQDRFGLALGMSGSGSACFAFLPPGMEPGPLAACIHDAWGLSAFVVVTTIR